jgi:hypothetical protein
MKIVQTFWSGSSSNIIKDTFGWYASEYHLMSWALSCLQLRKFYDNIVLYTDKNGYKLLIEYLKLPYTDVIITLDELNKEDSDLWAMSKIYTYSKQDEPFLHVDGDVFIWEAFNKEFLKANLIAQNKEVGTANFYESMFHEIEKELVFSPEDIKIIQQKHASIFTYNAGILGGHNIDFFKKYTSLCFKFIEKNRVILSKINKGNFNVYFEQFFFFCLSEKYKQKVDTLYGEIISDNDYRGMGDFELAPTMKKYLHLIGPFKRDYKTCRKMSWILRENYPDYYYKIINLFPEKYKNELALNNINFASYNSKNKTNKVIKHQDYYRTKHLYKEITNKKINVHNLKKSVEILKIEQLVSLYNYEKNVSEFTKEVISLDNNLLIERELFSLKSYNFFKSKHEDSLKMSISMNPYIKIIKTQWNWVIEENIHSLKNNLKIPPKEIFVLLIPELENPKYSEFDVDDLDQLIIKIIKNTSLTVFEMLEKLKEFFDPKDLESSLDSFHKLIEGRIENLIFRKCINIA